MDTKHSSVMDRRAGHTVAYADGEADDFLSAGFTLTLSDVTAKNDSGHDYTCTVNADGEVVYGEYDDAYYQLWPWNGGGALSWTRLLPSM